MYKAALIGCGARSSAHADAYEHIDNAEVVACCDLLKKQRDQMAGHYNIMAYDNATSMIESEQPDMVHIVTPPNFRVDILQLVSDLGVPLCTVEKPISIAVTDWQALCELEKNSKTRYGICHQFRWHPNVMKCQQAVMSGAIGDVQFLDMSARMNILGQGTHTLNYGRSLIGDPKVVQVFGNIGKWDDQSDPIHPGPAMTEAMLVFDNGVRGLWSSGNVSRPVDGSEQIWEHLRITAYGGKGRTTYEEFGKWEIVSEASMDSGDWGGTDTWHTNNDLAQARFHQAMFDWLEDENKVPGTNLADSLHEWAVILALYQSALTHQPVKLSDFQPPTDLIEQVVNLI